VRTAVPTDIAEQFDAPPAAHMDAADVRATGVQAPMGAANTAPAAHSQGSREISLDQQLFGDEVAVERVAINRIVDQVPETRQEGDVLIIPVLEEVLTVQKRLLLKEEVRIQRRRSEIQEPRRVVLDGNEMRIIGSDGREIDSAR